MVTGYMPSLPDARPLPQARGSNRATVALDAAAPLPACERHHYVAVDVTLAGTSRRVAVELHGVWPTGAAWDPAALARDVPEAFREAATHAAVAHCAERAGRRQEARLVRDGAFGREALRLYRTLYDKATAALAACLWAGEES